MKVLARVKPNGRMLHDRRRKVTDFYTVDQRLLAEIRDLLLILVNRDLDGQIARVANATTNLGHQVETLRKVIEDAQPSAEDGGQQPTRAEESD